MTEIQIIRGEVLAFEEWQYNMGIKPKDYNISLMHT